MIHQLLSLGIVPGLHGIIQLKEAPNVELYPALLLQFKGSNRAEIFPDQKCFEEPFLGSMEFVTLEQEVDCLNGLVHLLNRFVGNRVES